MEKVNSGVVFATTIMTFLFSILARVVESTVDDFAEFTNLMIFIFTKHNGFHIPYDPKILYINADTHHRKGARL